MILNTKINNLCFDDILLVPKHSKVSTRSDISLKTKIGNPNNPNAWVELEMPIMTAPMEFINSNSMIEKVLKYGGIAFINRFQSNENRFLQVEKLLKNNNPINRLGFAISIKESEDLNFINKILSYGIKILLIDTAYGHTEKSIIAVKQLRLIVPSSVHIMTGNVSSSEAYADLMAAGADSVRVGIGGGAACTTRLVTGFGVPVLSSIMDVFNNIKNDQVNGLISDGGIKNSGDIVKALAAGASAVMMGSLFAGHNECDKTEDGKFLFRGLASEGIQKDPITGQLPSMDALHIEGSEGYVDSKGSVENTINSIINNIKSGLSYVGSINFNDFRKDCTFIVVSALSLTESKNRI